MNATASGSRPGFVLVTVLVVMMSAILIATGALFLTRAEASSGRAVMDASASRGIGWSAMQVIMHELDGQRDIMLDGDMPDIEDEYIIYETAATLGIVRLIPMGIERDLLVSESGKLDLNHVDAETLALLPQLDEAIASEIVRVRDRDFGGVFESAIDLLQVEGITPELLYGPLDDLSLTDELYAEEMTTAERVGARLGVGQSDRLLDFVTVFAAEPTLQRNGKLQINLNVPWSQELARRLDDRFGEGTGEIVKQLMTRYSFDDRTALFNVLNDFNVDPEEWVDACDVLAMTDESYVFGRVDINRAPESVLAALPGCDADMAAAIVDARDHLGADVAHSIAWPAIEGVVETEAYRTLGAHLTTRNWNWRLRLAAGEVSVDEPDGPLLNPVIYEVVIDLSDPTPRVAYWRDITLLQMTAIMALNATEEEEFGFGDDDLGDWIGDPEQSETFPSDEGPATLEDLMRPWPGDEEGADGSDVRENRDSEGGRPDLADDTQGGNAAGGDRAPSQGGASGKRLGRWRTG